MTEIASVHGSSEAWDSPGMIYNARKGNFVRDVLDVGHRLGFIGSGDSHDGHPGLAHLVSPSGGLAGILAEENGPEELRSALQARACYATNGPRIVVDARLVVEPRLLGSDPVAYPMGAEVPAAELSPDTRLEVLIAGTEELERLEVVRSGKVVRYLDRTLLAGPALPSDPDADTPEPRPQGTPDFAALFTLEELGLEDLQPGEYAYLRIRQAHRGLAWTSPWFAN